MSAFTRQPKRFPTSGVQLTRAMDACDPGKVPYAVNVRSYIAGEVQSRDGLMPIPGASFGAAIHTVDRFDDPTPFAGIPNEYILGVGSGLYAGSINGPWPQIDSGYSGNPLSLLAATPPQSPQPWLYVADSLRMRKINANSPNLVYPVGIASPAIAPTVVLQPLGFSVIQLFQLMSGSPPIPQWLPWVAAGTQASNPNLPLYRVNTNISSILYDSGSSNSQASIIPTSMSGIGPGMLVQISGAEVLAVQQTTIAITPTTIAAILYDSGSTGLCTIQPVGSLGVGQLEAPTYAEYQRRVGVVIGGAITGQAVPKGTAGAIPPVDLTAVTPRIRQLDFPVNAIVTLGGSETVRILSVALGPDGVQSFRCSTANTHGAGEAIVGIPSFRAYVVGAYVGSEAIQDGAVANVLTPVSVGGTPVQFECTAGVKTGAGWPGADLSQVNGRATLPDDDLHLSIRFSDCTSIQTVRVYFDIDASVNDFTQNYFFFEWRSNDIITAIQAANADPVASLQQARAITVANTQLNAAQLRRGPPPADATPGGGIATTATSQQLALGNNQWLELTCKISQLQQVGTDPSRTLANVKAAEILVDVQNLNGEAIQVAYDALWISGGFGPDVGQIGDPYVYSFRYRSSTTGAQSNPSPPTRAGVIARRQQVNVSAPQSLDPQADLVDWFRLGGALTRWTLAGTTPNIGSPLFLDTFTDSSIDGRETPTFQDFQPWPVQDLPRSGVCNIAGSAIQWVSGALFNTAWAAGSAIIINGQTYTLYSQPPSATLIFINENAGSGSGIPFYLPEPTLLSQPSGTLWGGPVGGATFLFAVDPINVGHVRWTTGNNNEVTSDSNELEVTPGSEPLQNGYMDDGVPYVASTDNLYVLEPASSSYLNELTFGSAAQFRPLITPCGKGFWTPWAFALGNGGCYFLEKNGISFTAGGSLAKSVTDADLYPLFPHDGVPGVPTNGYSPVDMTQTSALRLSFVSGYLHFDYVDTLGVSRALVMRAADQSWWPDVATSLGVRSRLSGVGVSVHQMLCGGSDGQLYVPSGITDNGNGINCTYQIVENQGDVRREKLYRDLMLDAIHGGAVTVQLGMDNNTNQLTPQNLVGILGRAQYYVDTALETGTFGTNLTATFTWNPVSQEVVTLVAYDVAFQPCPEMATSWLSGPRSMGLRGYGHVPLALIAYRSTTPVTLSVIIDGATYTYTLPSTNNLYAKNKVVLQAVKGKAWQWGIQSASPCMVWENDSEMWLQNWAAGGGYQVSRVF